MQIKTIQKTIQKKLNEWLETIKDKGLSNDVKDNLLLSGGSIASMLLNSDVNDYDIYIQDIDILLQLTEHYIKSYNISILDGRKKDQLIEEDFNGNENLFTITVNNLKEDQIKFVQKSVANNITDYLKVNFEAAKRLLKEWSKSTNQNTQWIIKHATRKIKI